MNVLFIGMDDLRWGPARLPKFMQGAGFHVAALCPATNPLAHTKYVERRFELPRTKSARVMAHSLRAAMEAWQPKLVVPADELAVALMQAVLRGVVGGEARCWPAWMLTTLEASLGDRANHDAMLFKNQTQELAQKLGVRVPAGGKVKTFEGASTLAGRLGFPVVLKSSFSWGGDGVRVCADPTALAAAFGEMAPGRASPLKQAVRRILARDWFPQPQPLWLQQAIVGRPASYTFVAVAGRMLAGFAGQPSMTATATGHSTVIECGPQAEMAEMSARMAAALGVNGFCSFDFMIERATGAAFLLECNPRPTQVTHLGGRIGADLCAALHAGLSGGTPALASAPTVAHTRETIALFPHEWLRASDSAALRNHYHDVPWDDPRLVARFAADLDSAAA